MTTMQVKCYATSRRKSKAKLLSFCLSLGKYQPMGRGIFANDYLCLLMNVKKPNFYQSHEFFGDTLQGKSLPSAIRQEK